MSGRARVTLLWESSELRYSTRHAHAGQEIFFALVPSIGRYAIKLGLRQFQLTLDRPQAKGISIASALSVDELKRAAQEDLLRRMREP